MLKFSRTLGEKDEVELMDAELAAIHGGYEHGGRGHRGGRWGGLGFYPGFGYSYVEPVAVAVPITAVAVAAPVTAVIAAEPDATVLAAEPVTAVVAAEPLVVAAPVGLGCYGFGRRRR